MREAEQAKPRLVLEQCRLAHAFDGGREPENGYGKRMRSSFAEVRAPSHNPIAKPPTTGTSPAPRPIATGNPAAPVKPPSALRTPIDLGAGSAGRAVSAGIAATGKPAGASATVSGIAFNSSAGDSSVIDVSRRSASGSTAAVAGSPLPAASRRTPPGSVVPAACPDRGAGKLASVADTVSEPLRFLLVTSRLRAFSGAVATPLTPFPTAMVRRHRHRVSLKLISASLHAGRSGKAAQASIPASARS